MNERILFMILIILVIIVGIIFFINDHNGSVTEMIFQPTQTANWAIDSNRTEIVLKDKTFHFTRLNNETNTITVFKNNSTHPFNGTSDLIFEFYYKVANPCDMYLVDNNGGRINMGQSSTPHTWVHEKWVYDSTNHKITPYIDDVEQSSIDLSGKDMSTLGFQIVDWQGDVDLYIDDWRAYI